MCQDIGIGEDGQWRIFNQREPVHRQGPPT
jgi:hypothetical protein